ncbi:MAG: hypothetical protein AAFY88_10885 [Acidobacteriota bacterium]
MECILEVREHGARHEAAAPAKDEAQGVAVMRDVGELGLEGVGPTPMSVG